MLILCRSALILVVVITCQGCRHGFIYTNVTIPVATNMDKTPRGTKLAVISSKRIKEPYSSLGLSVEWDSRAIGDAARRAGLSKIYYTDLQTISVFGGVWKKQKILVMGK